MVLAFALLLSCQKEDDTLTDSDVSSIVSNSLNTTNEGSVSGSMTGETFTYSVPVAYNFSNDNKITLSSYSFYLLNPSADTVIYFNFISKLEDSNDELSSMYVSGRYNINADTLIYSYYKYDYTIKKTDRLYNFSSRRTYTQSNTVMNVTIDRASNKFTFSLNDVQTKAANNIVNGSGKEASIHFTYTYQIPVLRGGVIPTTNY
ncbi:MAG: hypothetical protein AB8B61_04045 [Cyclobacteriaceae bacterium]